MTLSSAAAAVRPNGTFKLTKPSKFSLKHVMERVIRIPDMRHNFFRHFVGLASLKVPSGLHLSCVRLLQHFQQHRRRLVCSLLPPTPSPTHTSRPPPLSPIVHDA